MITLATLPPTFDVWLSLGLLRIQASLAAAGLRADIVRTDGHDSGVPAPILEAALSAFYMGTDPELRRRPLQEPDPDGQDFLDGLVRSLEAPGNRLFGFAVFRTNGEITLEVCRRLKQRDPGRMVILGGPEATENGAYLAEPWIDAVVEGPGEQVAEALVKALADGRTAEVTGLPGVRVPGRTDADSVVSRSLPPVHPAPIVWEQVLPLLAQDPGPIVPMSLNWGCPHACAFCTDRRIYGAFMSGDPDDTVREIGRLARAWGSLPGRWSEALAVQFCDPSLDADPDSLDSLCRGLLALNQDVQIRFMGLMGLHEAPAPDVAARFVAAGFHTVEIGLESGSPSIRRSMAKPFRLETVIQGVERLLEAGLPDVVLSLIVGWPGETEHDFQQTLDVVRGLVRGPNVRINAMPFVKLPSANARRLDRLGGDDRGLLWRDSGEAGDPAVRLDRMKRLFDTFHGVTTVDTPLPLDLLVSWMQPGSPDTETLGWLARHKVSTSVSADIASRIQRALKSSKARQLMVDRDWRLVAIKTSRLTATVRFDNESGDSLAIQIGSAGSMGAGVYTRQGSWDLRYRWQSVDRAVDLPLVDAIVELLVAELSEDERVEGGSKRSEHH